MADDEKIPFDDDEGPIHLEGGDEDEERWSLVEPEEAEDASGSSSFSAFGASADKKDAGPQFKRPLQSGPGATRCRVFHSKIQESALGFLQQQINEWLDNSEAEVKHVGQVVGEMHGKSTTEPCVVVFAWY